MTLELLERRTRSSKTHQLGGRKYALDSIIGALHYKDDYADESEEWKDIDTTILPDGTVRSAPYELDITFNPIAIIVRSKEDGSEVGLELSKAVGRIPALDVFPIVPKPLILGNLCIFKDVFADTDIIIEAGSTWVRFKRVLKSERAPTECHFKIEETGKRRVSALRSRARDASDEMPVDVERVGNKLIERISTEGRIFPIEVDPLPDVYVVASADDSLAWSDSSASNSNVNFIAGATYSSAARFTGITIPSGATIDVAYKRLKSRSAQSGTAVLSNIRGEDAAAPAQYGASEDFRDRTYLATLVVWDNIAAWSDNEFYNSPSITTIIAALLSAHGPYSSGVIALMWEDDGGDAGAYRLASSYDDGDVAPMLHVEFTEAGGEISIPVVLHHLRQQEIS